MKVLHLPTSVAGNPIGLSKGERRIGIDSHTLDIDQNNKFGFSSDIKPCLYSLKKFGIPGQAISLFTTFLKYRNKYDVFHFNAGHTLLDYYPLNLHYLDLPFYPKNKKIIMTFNGSDARQSRSIKQFSSLDTWDEEISYNHLYDSNIDNQRKQKRIKLIDRYADHIFTVNPDLFRFLPERTKFLPYTISSWYKLPSVPRLAKKSTIKIIHAPSSRKTKGSEYILDALYKLKSYYKNVEILLIENMNNKKALELYAEADLVIDQVLLGWYGGLAVEVMKLGKPVMVFIRKSDLQFIAKEMAEDCLNTFITVDPTNILDTLRNLVENPYLLSYHASASLDYVNKWHDPIKVAKYVASFY